MANRRNGVEEYLHRVSQLLDCPSAKKKEILGQVKLSLQDIPGIESMTSEEIYEITDSPEELAEAYMEKVQIKKNAKLKRWLLLIIAVFAVVMLALYAIKATDIMSYNRGNFGDLPVQSGVYYGDSSAVENY